MLVRGLQFGKLYLVRENIEIFQDVVFRDLYFQFLSNYDMYVLGYTISHCGKLWSLGLRTTTKSGLKMFSLGLNSTEYCHGSINELDLHQSPGVMNSGGHLLQIPHHALQTVTVLNLAGSEMNVTGFENLAKCIPRMPNLISLSVNDNPGGVGCLVTLMEELKVHQKLLILFMDMVTIGLRDVSSLSEMIQSSNNLRMLEVGGSYQENEELTAEVDQELVKIVLLPSSLDKVKILIANNHGGCLIWDKVETISTSISSLTFFTRKNVVMSITSTRETIGCTKFSTILRENTSLRDLRFLINLNRPELNELLNALEESESLERLQLYKKWEYLLPQSQMIRFHFSVEFKEPDFEIIKF